MSRIRLILMSIAAVLTVGAVSASAAFAEPEFLHAGAEVVNKGFTSVKEAGTPNAVLKAGANTVLCTGLNDKGKINGFDAVKEVLIEFTGCESAKGTCEKPIKGKNDTVAGTITTNELDGELGTVAAAEATSERGLLLLPEGTSFVELAANECTIETKVIGTIACEVTPKGVEQLTGLLVCATAAGAQKIKTITTLAGAIKPRLEAFAAVATEEATSEETFEELVEVT